jgi:hypothetical protein
MNEAVLGDMQAEIEHFGRRIGTKLEGRILGGIATEEIGELVG